MIKTRAEIKKIENTKMQKINKIKVGSLRRSTKLIEPFTGLTKKKERRIKLLKSEIKLRTLPLIPWKKNHKRVL